MAEIYRDTVGLGIQFGIPTATVTKAEFYRDGTLVTSYNNASTVQIPYAITKMDGPFNIKWYYTMELESHVRTEEHQVVTPVFTKTELTAWDSDFTTLTDAKVVYLERLIREIIQTYTNQKFGYREGSITLWGNGSARIYSDERIISLDNPVYSYLPDGYGIHTGSSSFPNTLNVKIPIQEEILHEGLTGVTTFKDGLPYTFTGTFGWVSVPEEVKTAALYLAEAFTCNESLWKERYIKSIRAADWRFDFSEETFRSTGSLIADQLLDPYVRIGYAII